MLLFQLYCVSDVVMNEPKISPEELSPDSLEQDTINSMYLHALEYTDSILRFPHPAILNSKRHELMKAYYATMLQKYVRILYTFSFS